jgi:ribonuclease Z
MKASIQIISPPTTKSPSSFIIHFDSGSYLFNSGEGTQRIVNQNKVKLGKLKAIFNSQMNWGNLGGLPGMILTISDTSLDKLSIVGPLKLVHFLAANRQFLVRPNLSINVESLHELEQQCFKDENLVVQAISILHKDSDFNSFYNSLRNDESQLKKKRKLLSAMFDLNCLSGSEHDRLVFGESTTSTSSSSMVYICKGPSVSGKMDGRKAAELGVKPPDRKKLINGDSVVSISGKLVSPSDCVGPSKEGSVIVIIDCPSLNYLDSLLDNKTIHQWIFDTKNPPKTIIHQISSDVLQDKRYQKWLLSISTDTQQVMLCQGLHEHEIIFDSSLQLLELLHHIDPALFPNLRTNNQEVSLPIQLQYPRFHIGSPRTVIEIEPKTKLELFKFSRSTSIPEDIQIVTKEVLGLKAELDVEVTEYPYIVPLGTASCIPSKHRNVSSNYIRMEQGSVLLDVGEGTLAQLSRHFGNRLDDELKQLQLIFVSHLHADHHLGAFGVIKAWVESNKSNTQKLFVIGPTAYYEWLVEYADIEDYGLGRVIFVDSSALTAHDLLLSSLKASLRLRMIKTIPVVHCAGSYAIVIQDQSFFKFSYSGDCRPSQEFIAAGQNSDLLIHEATFEDSMLQEAIDKRHSTIGEAIDVGKRFMQLT